MRPLVLTGFLVLLTLADGVAGEVIRHPTLRFSLRAPDGMERQPAMEQDEVIFAFGRDSKQIEGRMILARVVRYGGLLDEVPIKLTDLPAGARLEAVRWKDFNLQVTRRVLRLDDNDYLTFVTQVPLKPEAVQVSVVGPPEDETELRAILQQTLVDLDGETNWQSGRDVASHFLFVMCGAVVVAGLWGLIIVLFFRWLRRIKRRRSAADVAAAERWWREHREESGTSGPAT